MQGTESVQLISDGRNLLNSAYFTTADLTDMIHLSHSIFYFCLQGTSNTRYVSRPGLIFDNSVAWSV